MASSRFFKYFDSISYLAKYVLTFLCNDTTDDLLSTLLYYGSLQGFLYLSTGHYLAELKCGESHEQRTTAVYVYDCLPNKPLQNAVNKCQGTKAIQWNWYFTIPIV